MGLLITEGTQPSADGQGYANTPGLHEAAHVAGWRRVTEAVHAAGGRVFIQLMHAGRMSHPDNTLHHRQALAPSAVADRIGAARTGLRLSPGSVLGGVEEGPERADLYRHPVAQLAPLGLAYLHVVQGRDETLLREIRRLWPNVLIVNRPGRGRQSLSSDLDAGLADMVSVGRMALSNPDLPARIREDLPLNEPDPATFYGGGEAGYTDYPAFQPA